MDDLSEETGFTFPAPIQSTLRKQTETEELRIFTKPITTEQVQIAEQIGREAAEAQPTVTRGASIVMTDTAHLAKWITGVTASHDTVLMEKQSARVSTQIQQQADAPRTISDTTFMSTASQKPISSYEAAVEMNRNSLLTQAYKINGTSLRIGSRTPVKKTT